MALENGIVVRTKEESELFLKTQLAELGFDTPALVGGGYSDFNYEYDITYWEKCYGIRSYILGIIRKNHNEDTKNKFLFELTVDDLKDVQWFIYQCSISKRYFDNQTNSIFEYDVMRPVLERQVHHLETLIQEKSLQGDSIKVIFYDSY